MVAGGCAAGQTSGNFEGAVGMQETQLIAERGLPQETIASPEGGKILLYETKRMDQMAVMGGGAWGKPEQMAYWVDAQGKVEKVKYYPYGKRQFIFSSEQKRADSMPAPKKPAVAQTASSPPAPASSHMAEAAKLELRMSKEEVTHLLGLPDRTEGFLADGKPVVVWTYLLGDQGGRPVLTPLVFENGRLSGWGDAYYQTILRKAKTQSQ
ncbi:MAG: DUF3192 domain-containing protein [Syntrophobacterales bacterium]|nr:DUF3192 domain-containing protein [Syntrophobacterales bacterium]